MEIYSTVEAAEYLRLSVATVKYHLYVAKDLEADQKLAGRLVFTRDTLDQFNQAKRTPGAPRKRLLYAT